MEGTTGAGSSAPPSVFDGALEGTACVFTTCTPSTFANGSASKKSASPENSGSEERFWGSLGGDDDADDGVGGRDRDRDRGGLVSVRGLEFWVSGTRSIVPALLGFRTGSAEDIGLASDDIRPVSDDGCPCSCTDEIRPVSDDTRPCPEDDDSEETWRVPGRSRLAYSAGGDGYSRARGSS